nr:Chain C, Vif HW8 peptide from Virion infectivity factor [Simian immunodeficiency virus]
HLEVQGYW